jgi:hypothetical protein
VGRSWKNPRRFVVSWPFSKKIPSSRIMNFIRKYRIESSNYGIYISLSASKKSEKVEIPKKVLSFYKRFGGQIDFSYIYIKEG